MKKVLASLLVLCLIFIFPLVRANPVNVGPHTSPNTAIYIAMVLSIIALLDLMIYLARKKKLLSKISLRHSKRTLIS